MYQAKHGIPLKGKELKEYEDFCNIGIVLDDEEKSLQDDRIYDRKNNEDKQEELF